jgi:hypothetical protein
MIYVAGGQFGHDVQPEDTNVTSGYNVTTDTWQSLQDLATPRSHAEPGTIVINDRVCLFGGRNNQGPGPEVLSNAVEYDPETDTWTNVTNLPQQSYEISAGFFQGILVDGDFGDYVVITAGGTNWNVPSNETWISRIVCSCCNPGGASSSAFPSLSTSGAESSVPVAESTSGVQSSFPTIESSNNVIVPVTSSSRQRSSSPTPAESSQAPARSSSVATRTSSSVRPSATIINPTPSPTTQPRESTAVEPRISSSNGAVSIHHQIKSTTIFALTLMIVLLLLL